MDRPFSSELNGKRDETISWKKKGNNPKSHQKKGLGDLQQLYKSLDTEEDTL